MTCSMVRFVLILFITPIDVVCWGGCCGGCFCGDMFGECRFVWYKRSSPGYVKFSALRVKCLDILNVGPMRNFGS